MSHNFLLNAIFHELLKAMDYDLSEEERAKGCPHCGGTLHRADYPRSPVGIPIEHREHYEDRYSHCCSQCRKRTTSPSLRFFGRRWYPAPLFIWISTLMRCGINKCCEKMEGVFGIILSKRTCKRWKGWWQGAFKKTNFWKRVAGIIPVEHLSGSFPGQLFSMYIPCDDNPSLEKPPSQETYTYFERQLAWVLRFLAPLTRCLKGVGFHAEFASFF